MSQIPSDGGLYRVPVWVRIAHEEAIKTDTTKRLNRIEGQIGGLTRMVEEERPVITLYQSVATYLPHLNPVDALVGGVATVLAAVGL